MGGRCQGAAPEAEGQAPDAGAQTVEWCSRRGTGWTPPLSSSLLLSCPPPLLCAPGPTFHGASGHKHDL